MPIIANGAHTATMGVSTGPIRNPTPPPTMAAWIVGHRPRDAGVSCTYHVDMPTPPSTHAAQNKCHSRAMRERQRNSVSMNRYVGMGTCAHCDEEKPHVHTCFRFSQTTS
jgi:hypothetical protein